MKENNITLTHPWVLDEWDFERNVGLDVKDFTFGSGKKVWWKCKTGIEEFQLK